MQITIREYNSTDKNECLKAFKSNVPSYFSEEEIAEFADFIERIGNGTDNLPYYVIIYNEKIIGCGGYAKAKSNDVFALTWGLIHDDYKKKGLGEKLLLYRLDQIKQTGIKSSIIIETSQHSAGFFEKYGFVAKKEIQNYYAPGMHRIDMELKF